MLFGASDVPEKGPASINGKFSYGIMSLDMKPIRPVLKLKHLYKLGSGLSLRNSSFLLNPGKFHIAWQASDRGALGAHLGADSVFSRATDKQEEFNNRNAS